MIPAIKAEYLAVCRGHKHSRESNTSKRMTIKRSLNNDKGEKNLTLMRGDTATGGAIVSVSAG